MIPHSPHRIETANLGTAPLLQRITEPRTDTRTPRRNATDTHEH